MNRKMFLVLFFTRGMSLKAWDELGTLERETALYRRLQDKGFSLGFVTYGDATESRYADSLPGVEILSNSLGLPLRLYERLIPVQHARALRRADVIKTNQTYGGLNALRAAEIFGKPLIARCGYMWSWTEAQTSGWDSPAAQRALAEESRVFQGAQRIVVTTDPMKRFVLEKHIGGDVRRISVVPNYVDTERFKPEGEERQPRTVIFIGRISPEKNVDAILEAVKPLDIQLTIIGQGPMRELLQDRFGSLDGRVTWIARVPNAAIPSYLNRSELYCQPSTYEGHPKTLIEAMACGMPVIGSDAPGIRDLITHQRTGWLCNPRAESIREAIEVLLGDSHLRKEIGAAAREFVLKKFSLNRIVEEEGQLLRDVCAQQR